MMANIQTHTPAILIVEDSPAQARRYKRRLEKEGCFVEWAADGLSGLQAAENKDFDLIILDIELPDINGYQVCRNLKENADLANIPVIMLTTRDSAEDALMGLEYGAIDYIPKDPFAELVLSETIRQMFYAT
jgi:DNA-binding response OmpR family regulator